MPEESQVKTFYTGKNIFITGGTGFVGLCLIEKILRCIPDVGNIYLLLRPKKGKEISQRLEEFPKHPVSTYIYPIYLCEATPEPFTLLGYFTYCMYITLSSSST